MAQKPIKKKLTKSVVDTAKPMTERYHIQDSEIPGFALRVHPGGKKSYVLDYREGTGRNARRRNLKIGDAAILTPDQARAKARHILSEVISGMSPAAIRDMDREKPTLEQFINERYFPEYAEQMKKESSVETDRKLAKNHLIPNLGKRKVNAITEDDCKKLHQQLTIYSPLSKRPAPGIANKVIALLSRIMTLCEEWGLRDRASNPCAYIKKNEGQVIERYLDPEKEVDPVTEKEIGAGELERFLKACQESLNDDSIHPRLIFIYLILFATGARCGEIMLLTIDELHLDKGIILKVDHKGRRKNQTKPKVIELNTLAIAMLRFALKYLYVPGSKWVFESHRRPGVPYNNPHKPWKRLIDRAGIENFRIHDLRHTYSSLLFNENVAPQLVQGLLGHKDLKTTQGYSHLFRKRKREATEVVGDIIGNFFKLPEYDEDKIVSINKKISG